MGTPAFYKLTLEEPIAWENVHGAQATYLAGLDQIEFDKLFKITVLPWQNYRGQ